MKKYWLMKTEPSVFSFEDFVQLKNRTTSWEGVRNYQARNFMRDQFEIGDEVLIYHSGISEPVIPGIAKVVRQGYPDPSAMDPKSKYFDEDALKKGTNPWILVDVMAIHRFRKPVTRSVLKKQKSLGKMMVLQKGARLSVQPVSEIEFRKILELGEASPL